MNLALNCWFSQCYNTRIINAQVSLYRPILFYLLIRLTVYNRTITRFFANDKVVYQRVRREIRGTTSFEAFEIVNGSFMRNLTSWSMLFLACPPDLSTRSSTATHWARSATAWLPDWIPVLRILFSMSLVCRCFQVSDPWRAIYSTALVRYSALTGIEIFNQNLIFLWNFHGFMFTSI